MRQQDRLLDVTWAGINKRVNEVSQNAEEAEGWIKSIQEGKLDAITALTLSLTPNIQELEFGGWSHHGDFYRVLLKFFSRARDLQNNMEFENALSMSHLKKVKQEYWGLKGGMDIRLLIPFLSIPSVHTFWATVVAHNAADHGSAWMRPGLKFSNIKELSLCPANLDPDTMKLF
jgi:hypothetical protein